MELYQLHKIVQKYGDHIVLDIPELSLISGQIHGLLGANGAGKSTLLRLLAFLEAPLEGRLQFQGQVVKPDVNQLRLRREVCMVMQSPLMFAASVNENVAYGLKVRGIPGREIKRRVAEALDIVDLAGYGDRHGTKLSGGEMQRVALARAIVVRPRVLLLDEPTANLDPGSVAQIERLVRRIHEERGVTMVLVTHNFFQAKRLTQQVIFLHQGQLIEQAETTTFFAQPNQELTRDFVSGNLIY
ncbi:MAG: phosphate ABC transporter ATP-binding protein [Methylocystaceae bacterium]